MAIGLKGDELGGSTTRTGAWATWSGADPRAARAPASVDDPTRLLRALRYGARLDVPLELETERLALDAVADGALDTVSGERMREELLLLLPRTRSCPRRSRACASLGLDRALHPAVDCGPGPRWPAALGAMGPAPTGVRAGGPRGPVRRAVWLAPPSRSPRPCARRPGPPLARAAAVAPRSWASSRDERGALRAGSAAGGRAARGAGDGAGAGRPRRRRSGAMGAAQPRAAGDHRRRPAAPPACRPRPALGRALDETLGASWTGRSRAGRASSRSRSRSPGASRSGGRRRGRSRSSFRAPGWPSRRGAGASARARTSR